METVTSSPQTLDATSLSSFSTDVFLDLNGSREALSVWNGFIAGCVAGSAGVLVGHPLDTIKVRQQTSSMQPSRARILVIATRAIVREGPKSLYRGMAFPLASEGVRSSLFFGVYGKVLDLFGRPHHAASYSAIAVAAAVGGGVQGIAATPVELVKIQLQSPNGPPRFLSPFDCVRQLYSVGGSRMLFYGAKITVLRESPSFAIYMLTFTGLRRRLTPSVHAEPSLRVDLVAGGAAGLASWSLTMPVDVVKSRLQSDCPVCRASTGTGRYTGVVDCVVRSWRAEGLSVFLRGMMVTCVRAIPTNAVLLVVYVNAMRCLNA